MSPRAKRAEEVGREEASSAHSAGGHLVALALELGAVEFGGYCRLHGEEMRVKGSITGRWAHPLKTEDGRRALCVDAEEVIEVKR